MKGGLRMRKVMVGVVIVAVGLSFATAKVLGDQIIKKDLNNDGKVDVVEYYSGGKLWKLVRHEYGGIVGECISTSIYDEEGRVIRKEVDYGADGVPERWFIIRYVDGHEERWFYEDSNHDGELEQFQHFLDDVLIKDIDRSGHKVEITERKEDGTYIKRTWLGGKLYEIRETDNANSEKAKWFKQVLDKNRDGQFDYWKTIEYYENKDNRYDFKITKKEEFDTNADGRVDRIVIEEHTPVLQDGEWALKIIYKYDDNADGVVDNVEEEILHSAKQ